MSGLGGKIGGRGWLDQGMYRYGFIFQKTGIALLIGKITYCNVIG